MKPFVADVHTHSLMSGHAFGTIREMAAAASEQGLELLGVTEHGPGIPGTVNPIYFRNFGDAPRNLFGVEMLYGSEVNVLEGGKLDLDRRHLDLLDYAVVGIHGLCYENAGITANTDNLIRCMQDPKVRFVSHPDDAHFPLDYPALVQAAKEWNVALEVNNSSLRKPKLRPNCRENYEKMLPFCMELGVPIIVDSDAHDPSFVGEFSQARELLERLGFDESLILSTDKERLKKFLLNS